MQQVTKYLTDKFIYVRVFFFPRLTHNLVFVLNYLMVFVSHSNISLGRDGEGTSYIVICFLLREM